VRILLVDDHAIVREGLRRILALELEPCDVGEAANAAEAMEQIRTGSWDLVVLDISLPGRGGLEALKDIKATNKDLPVLVMTMYSESQYAVRAFRSGASGYITKDSAPDNLVLAVRKVLEGGKYVSAALAETLATNLTSPTGAALHDALSDRELQVLRMIGSGKTVKEIAVELSLSEKTISTYRTRVLEKLEMRTTAELIRYAIASRLVE
jgi:DNA-binding NarL/FixJ family response regulator